MNRKILEDIIDDVLSEPKYPDGTLKDDKEIIEKYLEKWEEVFNAGAVMGTHYALVSVKSLEYLAGRYGLLGQVKIKAKKGKIVIERIEE